MTTVIAINQLTRHFKEMVAVDNLSREVQAGEIFGFLGHNGAGKTTTVRLLNGVIDPTSGSMHVLGLDPQVDGPAIRARTGVLTETPSMEQRLARARALLHKPELLFLDEATSGLDPVSAHHVNELIERMARREGCTVFMCTHNLVEAQKLCDRVAILEHGRLGAL